MAGRIAQGREPCRRGRVDVGGRDHLASAVRLRPWVLAGAAGAAVLFGAGLVFGVILGPAPAGSGQAPRAAVSVTAPSHAGTAQALAAAQAAVADATAAANDAQQVVDRAKQAEAQVVQLASPTFARQPGAQDPSASLAPLQQASSALAADVQKAQKAAARAQTAATSARDAMQEVQAAQGQVVALLQQAQAAVQTWQEVHAAPPRFFGIQYRDRAPGAGVGGCEVDAALAGAPGAAAGLVGATQRTDPVGDVSSPIVDHAYANTAWPVTS